MTLPALVDYALPTEMPASQASWSLDPDRAALLVHDMQKYFLRPYGEQSATRSSVIAATAELLSAARAAGIPVFYTAQTGRPGPIVRGLQGDLWGPGMTDAPEHTKIVTEIAPHEGDRVLEKHRYSAFLHTDLEATLSQKGRDQLILSGIYAHIGVVATAMDAFQREIQPFVAGDAVAAFCAESHERALSQVAGCAGVVARTAEIATALRVAKETGGESETIDTYARIEAVLNRLLPDDAVSAAMSDRDGDLFALGLDSMRAFEMLDLLVDDGIDVDFGEFTRTPTVAFLAQARLNAR